MKLLRLSTAAVLASAMLAAPAESGELGGSLTSMRSQHNVAVTSDFTFLRTAADVRDFVEKGRLEMLAGNANYALSKVSFPYARPEVRKFVERIASDFKAATGERLVVTSLTRPEALQPRNAHNLSVHPAGMAVDFRVPADKAHREWLEARLLSMERDGLLDATRERHPPHYHVAVFPKSYQAYEEKRAALDAAEAALAATAITSVSLASVIPSPTQGVFALPVHPVLGGAATGFAALLLFAVGAGIAGRRRQQ